VARFCEDGDACLDAREVGPPDVSFSGATLDIYKALPAKPPARYADHVVHFSVDDGHGGSSEGTCTLRFIEQQDAQCAP